MPALAHTLEPSFSYDLVWARGVLLRRSIAQHVREALRKLDALCLETWLLAAALRRPQALLTPASHDTRALHRCAVHRVAA